MPFLALHRKTTGATFASTGLYTGAMAFATNPTLCPLCQQANQCAMAAGLPAQDCWCMRTPIAAEALARIPDAQRGQACVCARCGQNLPLSPTDNAPA